MPMGHHMGLPQWNGHPHLKASARPTQEQVLPRDSKQNAIRWWALLREDSRGQGGGSDISDFVDMILVAMRATPTEVTCETMFSRHDLVNVARRRGMKVENLIKLLDAWAWPENMDDLDVNDPRFTDLIAYLHRNS